MKLIRNVMIAWQWVIITAVVFTGIELVIAMLSRDWQKGTFYILFLLFLTRSDKK